MSQTRTVRSASRVAAWQRGTWYTVLELDCGHIAVMRLDSTNIVPKRAECHRCEGRKN